MPIILPMRASPSCGGRAFSAQPRCLIPISVRRGPLSRARRFSQPPPWRPEGAGHSTSSLSAARPPRSSAPRRGPRLDHGLVLLRIERLTMGIDRRNTHLAEGVEEKPMAQGDPLCHSLGVLPFREGPGRFHGLLNAVEHGQELAGELLQGELDGACSTSRAARRRIFSASAWARRARSRKLAAS